MFRPNTRAVANLKEGNITMLTRTDHLALGHDAIDRDHEDAVETMIRMAALPPTQG